VAADSQSEAARSTVARGTRTSPALPERRAAFSPSCRHAAILAQRAPWSWAKDSTQMVPPHMVAVGVRPSRRTTVVVSRDTTAGEERKRGLQDMSEMTITRVV